MNLGPIRVSVFGKSDLGRTREHNEDTFLVADLTLRNASLRPEVRDHVVGPRGSLFMVADGMGGAAAGEVASRMAADVIYRHLSTEWGDDPDVSERRFAFRMREAVERANHEIHVYARAHPEMRGMGTTATVAGVQGSNLYLAQIGDSRGYLARGGRLIQLTKDQSLMQRLVEAGELTEEEAEQSERRNIILQALGPDPKVKVELTYQPLRRGDTLVICSDGLFGLVKRDEIAEVIATTPDLAAVCGTLIDLANARGGSDNITVVLARFEGQGLPDADGAAGVEYRVYRPSGDVEPEEPPAMSMAAPPLAGAFAGVRAGGHAAAFGDASAPLPHAPVPLEPAPLESAPGAPQVDAPAPGLAPPPGSSPSFPRALIAILLVVALLIIISLLSRR
ncbi:MAG TPA: protein phosphatase 2C domain-containing protein [Gemmatimonadales bacterium]|nr:protein phosphatase 2C domain-containing protein [Gemmatimonadales bacterium]